MTHNPDNERSERRYFAYLKETKRQGEDSVDAPVMALARLEVDTRFRDFRAFHFEQAVAFKRRLARSDLKLRPGIEGVGKISAGQRGYA